MSRPARPWFRFYSEALTSLKAQSLKPPLFKHWMNLLCLANVTEPRGSLPSTSKVAFALRITTHQADAVLAELQDREFVDDRDGVLVMHDWDGPDGWQYDGDAGDNYVDPGEAGRRSNHARWHVKRGVVSPDCPYCIQGKAPKDTSLGLSVGVTREDPDPEKRREEAEPEAELPFNVFRMCEQFYGRPIGTMEIQSLKDLDSDFTHDCITHAFHEASDLNKKSIRYVRAICERHKKEGCFVDLRAGQANGTTGRLAAVAGPAWPRGYEPPEVLLF